MDLNYITNINIITMHILLCTVILADQFWLLFNSILSRISHDISYS